MSGSVDDPEHGKGKIYIKVKPGDPISSKGDMTGPKSGTNLSMSEGSIQETSYPQSMSEIYLGSRARSMLKFPGTW